MATKTKYFFEVVNEIIIGVHDYEIPSDRLENGHTVISYETDIDPASFLGTEAKRMLEGGKPELPIQGELAKIRAKLRGLHFEIEFTDKLGEDTSILSLQYTSLKTEYDNLKAAQ